MKCRHKNNVNYIEIVRAHCELAMNKNSSRKENAKSN